MNFYVGFYTGDNIGDFSKYLEDILLYFLDFLHCIKYYPQASKNW